MQQSSSQESLCSIVHTRQMVGQTNLRYSFRSAELNYSFQTDLRNIHTQSQPSTTVYDLSNQLSFKYVLPWNIEMNASCNLITRFGYTDNSLNRSVVLCGLSASRELGHFIFSLTANDIFHQNNRLTCVLNEQGRMETINRKYLPAYVLFHIYYRWEIAKKKRAL